MSLPEAGEKMFRRIVVAVVVCLATLSASPVLAKRRIIDNNDTVVLRHNTHPLARSEYDTGPADLTMPMDRMILSLNISPDKQAALDQLLADQQDPASPDYHRWLTPEEFGTRFGPSDDDIAAAVDWLKSQGFTVDEIGAGRTWINFSGDVKHVNQAFHTAIHTYRVNGKLHHANNADPSIPRGLADLVAGVVSLNDFPRKSMLSSIKTIPRADTQPDYTLSGNHYMSPGDFATIYNLKQLYNANTSIDGTGTTIAIVGRCNIHLSDIETFRSKYGLPAKDPVIVVNGTDPGVYDTNEEGEAILDVEWSGAVAKNATIKFVVSKSTTTDGIDLSAQYIVNNNLAPVMSTSFGSCEASMGTTENAFYNNLWTQAAAQGITAFVSTGDSGAAGCDAADATTATHGLAVNGIASTPYNVAVGGSEFNEGTGTYWNATNAGDKSSALSYIPEVAWNESGSATYCPSDVAPCANLWATGGGVSTKYTKPSWQVSPGVPSDGKRDLPDVALTASVHDGYTVFQSDQYPTTNNSSYFGIAGGTSAASPSMAGIMALVVQKTGQRQGNANPRLYQLAAMQYGPGGTAIFHDAIAANNSVPGVTGYSTGTGYDPVTGLGSVDAAALVANWLPADLTVAASHTGTFYQGETGATYTITVTNSGSGPVNGAVIVNDSLPTGLTATAFAGSGWSCTLSPPACSRSDVLNPGLSYPPITLTVNVATTAAASIVNTAAVSGGGEQNTTNDTTSDTTGIVPASPTATSATNVTTTGFTANWNGVSGATGYRMDVATDSGFTGFVSGFNNKDVGNVTSFAVSGLTPSTVYYYRVRAYNAAGTGASSATITVPKILAVAIGAGTGTVNSSPSGIACDGSSGCSATFAPGTSVSLTATPDWKSLFGSWGGDCTGSGNPCTVAMSANRNVSVTFIPDPEAILASNPAVGYATLQDAYNAAAAGTPATILAQVHTFVETLQFDRAVSVVLDGGADPTYQTTIGVTTIAGSLTIGQGTVTVNNLVIR